MYPPAGGGEVAKFDDLPARYRGNVNVEPPFDRDAPALTEQDRADIIAFLQTLNDGYRGADLKAAEGQR